MDACSGLAGLSALHGLFMGDADVRVLQDSWTSPVLLPVGHVAGPLTLPAAQAQLRSWWWNKTLITSQVATCSAYLVGAFIFPPRQVATCSAYPVGVVLDVLRAVEVDHVLHPADIDTATCER